MKDDEVQVSAARKLHLPPDVMRITLRERAFGLPIWLRPSDVSPDGTRSWLASVCEHLNITPSALALRAGFAASTLNRFVSGRTKAGGLNSKTILRIVETVTELFSELEKPESFDPTHFPKAWEIEISGSINGPWFNKPERYFIKIPMPHIALDNSYVGFEVRPYKHIEESFADLLIVNLLPNIDIRTYTYPQRVVYSSLVDGNATLHSGWCLCDPAGFGWIMPEPTEENGVPLPLGRSRGLVHQNTLIIGPVVTSVGFFAPTYEQECS